MAEQMLRVKAVDPTRVGLWDKNPAHPGGEVWVTGTEECEVADTTEVRDALTQKRIVEVRDQPKAALPEAKR